MNRLLPVLLLAMLASCASSPRPSDEITGVTEEVVQKQLELATHEQEAAEQEVARVSALTAERAKYLQAAESARDAALAEAATGVGDRTLIMAEVAEMEQEKQRLQAAAQSAAFAAHGAGVTIEGAW